MTPTMQQINHGRLMAGGITAALIVFVVAGALPGILLAHDLERWHEALGALYTPPPQALGLLFFAVMSLVFGMTAMWIYVVFRAQYGSGPRTATLAGVAVWLLGWVTAALGHLGLGDNPTFAMTIVPTL